MNEQYLVNPRQYIVKPREGWEQWAWYLVDVAYFVTNPIHRALFFTGFLDEEGNPGRYHSITPIGTFNGPIPLDEIAYLKPIKLLVEEHEQKGSYDVMSKRIQEDGLSA